MLTLFLLRNKLKVHHIIKVRNKVNEAWNANAEEKEKIASNQGFDGVSTIETELRYFFLNKCVES